MKQPSAPTANFKFSEDPVWTPPPFPSVGAGGLIQAPLNLTVLVDDLLFNFLLPPFEKVFAPMMYQKFELAESVHDLESKPKLAQSELLLSLKSLASVPQVDVRNDSIQGLLALLQEGGHAVEGGWEIVFDLLMSIPLSMSEANGEGAAGPVWPKESLLSAFTCMKLVVDDFLEELPYEVIIKAVHCVAAFSAQVQDVNVSLTSIEMLWKVTDYIMTSSRKLDDQDTSSAALDVMLDRLSHLSVDSRPEIRNCATNTLFSAVLSNAGMLSPDQWRSVFDDIVFPLFEATQQKSLLAMSSKAEAMTPELKKGVKMALHHSRDTAHKQWLETRVLALRGTCRAIKAGSRNLSLEPWFENTWRRALDVCLSSLQVGTVDLEVCVASVDMLFDMVKMVATQAYRSKARAGFGMRVVGGALVTEEANIARTPAEVKAALAAAAQGTNEDKGELDGLTEVAREKLWQSAWSAVRDCVCYERIGSDLALHICNQLKDLYSGGMDGEFRYSQNVKTLLELVVCIARPRTGISLPPIGASSSLVADGSGHGASVEQSIEDGHNIVQLNAKMNKIADSQLARGVILLLRTIAPVDIVAFSSLMTTLSELAFGRSCIEMSYSVANTDGGAKIQRCIVLGPVDAKLRGEIGEYIISILSAKERAAEAGQVDQDVSPTPLSAVFLDIPPSWLGVCLEVVVKNFVNDLCFRPSLRRSNLVGISSGSDKSSRSESASPNGKKHPVQRANSFSSSSGIGGFFSSIGKMLTNTLESVDDEDETDSAVDDEAESMESLAVSSSSAAAFRNNMIHPAGMQRPLYSATGCVLSALREESGVVVDFSGSPDANVATVSSWKPFSTSTTDLKILHLLFRLGLRPALVSANCGPKADKSGSSDSRPSATPVLSVKQKCIWSHVLTSVLCILSPWREVELVSSRALPGSANPSDASGDGISLASDIISVVGAVVTFLIDSRYFAMVNFCYFLKAYLLPHLTCATLMIRDVLPTDLTLQLVDSICACCRLTVVALKASFSPTPDAPPQPLTHTYLGVLDYCRGFMSILSSSQHLARVVRKRSIRGALLITRDLMAMVDEPAEDDKKQQGIMHIA